MSRLSSPLLALALTLCGALATRAQETSPLVWLPSGVSAALAQALARNPDLVAARQGHVAAAQRARALDAGFYEPQAAAAAGWSRGPVAAPGAALAAVLPGEAASAQAGLTAPLRPGLRLGAGVAQRYLFEVDGLRDLGQTVAGVRLEAPLLRDRGFRSQRLRQAAADEQLAGLGAAVTSVWQTVARDTLTAYASWLYAAADLRAACQASRRVEQLRDDTVARVALQATAEYQLFPAQLEVAFRQEEVRQAEAALSNAAHRLDALLAGPLDARVVPDGLVLRAWAGRCATGDLLRAAGALAQPRPELLQAGRICRAADRLVELAGEQVRSDLSLAAGVGYRAEDEDGGLGGDSLLDDHRAGVEAALVWRRPLSFDAEEAGLAAARADAWAAREQLRRLGLDIASEQARAGSSFAAARDRLGWVDRAVLDARRVLESEEERLRLGDGRSRNVLDAQKDLTTAERRANQAAFDTVRAFTDLLHATGVPLLPTENPHVDLDPAL